MSKVIVYSANLNGYDDIVTPKVYDPNVEYILFTDDVNAKSDVWKIKPVDFLDQKLDGRKKARYIKVNSHLVLPEHDISIWVDGCFEPRFDNVEKMLEDMNFGNSNVMIYKHPQRNCLYDEANVNLQYNRDTPQTVSIQMKRYHSMGFPKNYGLFETGFMIRKNTNRMKLFNEMWWTEIYKNSGRDQLSQMFVSWMSDIEIKPITVGENMDNNEFLHPRRSHKKLFLTK